MSQEDPEFQSAQLNMEAPLPPYLQQLKDKNKKLSQKQSQKRQQKLQRSQKNKEKQKKLANESSNEHLINDNAKVHANGNDIRLTTNKYDQKMNGIANGTTNGTNKNKSKPNQRDRTKNNETTEATYTPLPNGLATEQNISTSNNQNTKSLKRKRDLLPESLMNEYISKKRVIETEERLVEEADIDLSKMKYELLQQQKKVSKRVFIDALGKNQTLEVVYEEDISDPMDMPVIANVKVSKWLHQHFFNRPTRISSATFIKGKQMMRSFTPAYNFGTLSVKPQVKLEVIDTKKDKVRPVAEDTKSNPTTEEVQMNKHLSLSGAPKGPQKRFKTKTTKCLSNGFKPQLLLAPTNPNASLKTLAVLSK